MKKLQENVVWEPSWGETLPPGNWVIELVARAENKRTTSFLLELTGDTTIDLDCGRWWWNIFWFFWKYIKRYNHPGIFRVRNWSTPKQEKMIQQIQKSFLIVLMFTSASWGKWFNSTKTFCLKLDASTTNYIACLTHPVSLPSAPSRRTRWRRVPATTMHSELPCKRKSKTGDFDKCRDAV